MLPTTLGFCKHADKCFKSGNRCVNSGNMLDLEETWLAGAVPPLATPRSRPASTTSLISPNSTFAGEIECLLVLDIEGGANDRPGEDEIIELPVALVNLKTRKEEARFHRFIRPSSWDTFLNSEAPGSKRINARTSAVPFPQALTELEHWLQQFNMSMHTWPAKPRQLSNSTNPGDAPGYRSFLWATCGDWDLKTIFPKQCRKSGVGVPSSMRQWCNIKVLLLPRRSSIVSCFFSFAFYFSL
jgi:inhibitor of KinA sporulation pathway (predicted exonuclease)